MENEIQPLDDNLSHVKELDLTETIKNVLEFLPEHNEMLEVIQASIPEIHRASSLFYKTQSQFMDNMLTVSHLTPIRNVRQILAEMNKTRAAIKESHFKSQKKEIEILIKQKELANETCELKSALLKVEILELESQLESSKGYISGAIRKLTNYTEQFNSICEEKKISNFNEIDFEAEEEKYHIMKSFDQALTAARSRNGIIDEGNLIYLNQIGVNGAAAQKYIIDFLNEERKLLNENKEPTHVMVLNFLEFMSERFKGCSKVLAKYKGMTGSISEKAALKTGDTRLIQ